MTMALLTSRPSVVMASSPNEWPAGGSPLGESSTTSRPGPSAGSRAAARRSRRSARTTREQEQVEQGQEQQPDGPQDEEVAVHQSGAPATSTTIAVSPTSSRSPTPRTTSVTGTPLTREPLVLPRSE